MCAIDDRNQKFNQWLMKQRTADGEGTYKPIRDTKGPDVGVADPFITDVLIYQTLTKKGYDPNIMSYQEAIMTSLVLNNLYELRDPESFQTNKPKSAGYFKGKRG